MGSEGLSRNLKASLRGMRASQGRLGASKVGLWASWMGQKSRAVLASTQLLTKASHGRHPPFCIPAGRHTMDMDMDMDKEQYKRQM